MCIRDRYNGIPANIAIIPSIANHAATVDRASPVMSVRIPKNIGNPPSVTLEVFMVYIS